MLFVFYFLPAALFALTPHKKVWYFFDFFLIVYLYRELVKDIFQPAMFATFLLAVFPALVLKAVSIHLKQKDKDRPAKFLPFIGLLGPALCLFFPQQLNDLLSDLVK